MFVEHRVQTLLFDAKEHMSDREYVALMAQLLHRYEARAILSDSSQYRDVRHRRALRTLRMNARRLDKQLHAYEHRLIGRSG